MILVVGHETQWESLARLLPGDARITFAPFRRLSVELLRDLAPEMVICQLIGAGFDATDVGEILIQVGFEGCLKIVSPPLPNPALVRAEVSRTMPGIDVDLVIVTGRLS